MSNLSTGLLTGRIVRVPPVRPALLLQRFLGVRMRPHSAGNCRKGNTMTHGLATGSWLTWRLLTENEQALIMWGVSELEAVALARVVPGDLSNASDSEIRDAV